MFLSLVLFSYEQNILKCSSGSTKNNQPKLEGWHRNFFSNVYPFSIHTQPARLQDEEGI